MPDVMLTTGWVLIHFLWQGALLGAVAWLGCFLTKDCSANARYVFLCCILLLCGLCPVITWVWLDGHQSLQRLNVITLALPESHSRLSGNQSGDIDLQASCSPLFGPPLNYVRINEELSEWLPYLTKLWMVGVLVLGLRIVLDYLSLGSLIASASSGVDETHLKRFQHLVERIGIKKAVLLTESRLVEIPTVLGWFRPILIVPVTFLTSLPADQIEAIFAHELAHVRRYDYCVNILQIAIETLLFYHPAVWRIGHLIREERENCCDDIAIAISGDRMVYVSALATLEQIRPLRSNVALAASGGSLLKRVQRVFDPKDRSGPCLVEIVRESYEVAFSVVLMLGIYGAVSFAADRGSITRHVDSNYLSKSLVAAARDGRLADIETLLGQGADPNLNVRPDTCNALFAAVTKNQVEATNLLIRRGADVNSKNEAGLRPIDWALAKGNLALASILRDDGAAISTCQWAAATGDVAGIESLIESGDLKKGATDQTMKEAVAMGRFQVVKLLENLEGKPVPGKFLAFAAGSGNIPMMAYILKQGTPSRTDLGDALDQAVIFYNQPEAASFLLSHGADPNRFTRWRRFILSQATSATMMKVLLQAGANPNAEDIFGTPLSAAPDVESVRLLVRYGADIKGIKGRKTSVVEDFIIQSRQDRPDIVSEFVKQGAPLDIKTNGVGALALAAERNKVKTLKLLLDSGVDPNAFADGLHLRTSPLRIATMLSSLDAAEVLLRRGGFPGGSSIDGESPLAITLLTGDWDMTNLLLKAGARDVGHLSVAAAYGDLSEVSDLIERGADVNEVDREGNTPLFYAIQRHRADIADLLMRHGAVLHKSVSKL